MKTRYLFWGLLGLTVWAQAQLPDTSTTIPMDPATVGYTVNNQELSFKEHALLPKNSIIYGAGMIDSRYRLANLIADEKGSYEQDKIKKIVIVDTQTGELKPTPYEGKIECFIDGNLATIINPGRIEDATFSFGKYGELLQTWKGVHRPEGMILNLMSCTLQSREKLKINPPPGMSATTVLLRAEHGQLVVLEGPGLPGDTTANISPDVQRLMKNPFMKNMTLPASSEQWILKKPGGEEIAIPNNPGEATSSLFLTYLPYLDAYFMEPAARVAMPSLPIFARLLYPDGRVTRYSIPDVLLEPWKRREIGVKVFYTKVGLVWRVQYVRIDRTGNTNYKGELKEGYYLDKKNKKILVKIPDLAAYSQVDLMPPYNISNDGCRIKTRREISQKQPHLLLNIYYINLCTGE